MPTPNQVIDPITISNYSKMAWENTVQHYPTAKTLMQKGNINRDQGGVDVRWPIEAGRNDVYTTADYQDVASLYTMTREYDQATLDWGQLGVFKALSKGQMKRNSGGQALVNFKNKVIPHMFRDGLNGTTNSLFWHFFNTNIKSYTGIASNAGKIPFAGLPSVFTGTNAITWSSTAQEGTINNTNYAGLSCVSSGLTDVDNPEADAWTPKAFNLTSQAWAGGAANDTFRDNAFEILTAMISAGDRFDATDMTKQLDEIVMTRALYNDIAYQMQQKQSFLLSKAVGKKAMFGIGNDVMRGLEHNGVPIRWDGHIPANTMYGLNYDQIFLDLMPKMEWSGDSVSMLTQSGDDESIFETEVRYNDGRRALTVSATVDGQFRINPRYQVLGYAGT